MLYNFSIYIFVHMCNSSTRKYSLTRDFLKVVRFAARMNSETFEVADCIVLTYFIFHSAISSHFVIFC